MRHARSRRHRLSVRTARLEDVHRLAEFRLEMMRELHRLEGEPPPRPSAAALRLYEGWVRKKMRKGELEGFFALTPDGVPVASGFVWLQEFSAQPGVARSVRPRIQGMYTLPTYRHRGAASLIVRAAVRWARARHFTEVSLRPSVLGEPLYRGLGFRTVPEMHLDLRPPKRSRKARRG